MKRIFICSPFRAKNEDEHSRNIEYAQQLSKLVIDCDEAPYAPHLYLTDVLDDGNGAQRKKGIAVGLAFMDVCDEVLVGDEYGISAGMRKEIAYARRIGKPIEYVSKLPNLFDGEDDEQA